MTQVEIKRFGCSWAGAVLGLAAAALLCLGIAEPYRGKHEDNNALFEAFARGHVYLGIGVTRGHDTLYLTDGTVDFYGHHPPGGGLMLAVWSRLIGGFAPWQVRSLAVCATLTALFVFWLLMRRWAGETAALVSTALLAVLPQISYYGRMVNHEPLALPFLVLLVGAYLEILHDRERAWGAWLVFFLAACVAAGIGWIAFFFLAACGVHALLYAPRPGARELRVFAACAVIGVSLIGLDLAHIAWAKGDAAHLPSLLLDRAGGGSDQAALDWLNKMASFSLRHATISGTIAVLWLAGRVARRRWQGIRLQPVESIFAVFFLAGVAYLVVFNVAAAKHHYWQLPLAPAVALALWEALRRLWPRRATHRWAAVVLVWIVVEVLVTSGTTLLKRHTRVEQRVVETVEALRTVSAPSP